jgi:dihydrofolate reductase
MRDLVYYVASTLDGFIARSDGSFADFPWDNEFGAALLADFPETFPAHLRPPASAAENRVFDTVLMGRATYEVGLKEGISNPYPTLRQHVFSRSMDRSPDENVTLVRTGAVEAVRELKREPGRDIWLCGGATLANALFSAGLVDRMIVKLNPVVFGSGIPLLGQGIEPIQLELTHSRSFSSGHLLLHYRLLR